jgi:hypothetical protein
VRVDLECEEAPVSRLAVITLGSRRKPKDLADDLTKRLVVHAGFDQFERDYAKASRYRIVLDLVLAVDFRARKLATVRLKNTEQECENSGLADAIGR